MDEVPELADHVVDVLLPEGRLAHVRHVEHEQRGAVRLGERLPPLHVDEAAGEAADEQVRPGDVAERGRPAEVLQTQVVLHVAADVEPVPHLFGVQDVLERLVLDGAVQGDDLREDHVVAERPDDLGEVPADEHVGDGGPLALSGAARRW